MIQIEFQPDEFDLSQLRDTIESPGYRLLTERYTRIVEETRTALERCPPEEMVKLQTRIETLRTVMSLPAIVAASVKAKRGRRR
jgi:hypothetical protein